MQAIFNKRGASKALGVSVDTINRLLNEKKIPCHFIRSRIVFTESDLNTFLESCAIPATVETSPREKLEATKRASGGAA